MNAMGPSTNDTWNGNIHIYSLKVFAKSLTLMFINSTFHSEKALSSWNSAFIIGVPISPSTTKSNTLHPRKTAFLICIRGFRCALAPDSLTLVVSDLYETTHYFRIVKGPRQKSCSGSKMNKKHIPGLSLLLWTHSYTRIGYMEKVIQFSQRLSPLLFLASYWESSNMFCTSL